MTAAERLLVEALALPEEERVLLAERLLAVPPDPRVEDAWHAEAMHRLADYRSGADPGMTAEQALGFMVSKRP